MSRLAGLKDPRFWAWLALAGLPPSLLAMAFGWELVDPAYLGCALLWWPVDAWARLGALGILMRKGGPVGSPNGGGGIRGAGEALAAFLSAEILLSLRIAVWALAGLIPAAWAFSLWGAEAPGARLGVLALAGLGLVPAGLYAFRRLLAARMVLEAPLNGAEALESAAQRIRGRAWAFFRMAAPWIAASWALDALGMALPELWELPLGLASLALGLLPLALWDEGVLA